MPTPFSFLEKKVSKMDTAIIVPILFGDISDLSFIRILLWLSSNSKKSHWPGPL